MIVNWNYAAIGNDLLFIHLINQKIMFTEFLHPQLVLFGDFLNPKLGCNHHVEFKDGEITVHQILNRAGRTQEDFNILRQAEERSSRQALQENDHEELDGEQVEYLKREQQNYYQQEEEDEDEYDRMIGDYYGEDQDQYSDAYFPYNIAAQYRPAQLASILNTAVDKAPTKIDKIPFSKQSPIKNMPQKQGAQEIDEDEDWETQEEEENYVTNQLLQEAGGNFANDL